MQSLEAISIVPFNELVFLRTLYSRRMLNLHEVRLARARKLSAVGEPAWG